VQQIAVDEGLRSDKDLVGSNNVTSATFQWAFGVCTPRHDRCASVAMADELVGHLSRAPTFLYNGH
jgi:hypothetical protein